MANTTVKIDPQTATKEDLVAIYEEYSPGIYRYAVRLLGDAAMAEDCVSETFSRFLGAIQRGGGPTDNIRAYLYRVAHNWVTNLSKMDPIQLSNWQIRCNKSG